MEDFYHSVLKAIESDSVEKFLSAWNSDPVINLETDPAILGVLPEAYYESLGGNGSLEFIARLAHEKNREVAFAGILEGDLFAKFLVGSVGSQGMCDWEDGTLIEEALEEGLVSLGHTHPRHYAAMCSNVKWTLNQLKAFGEIGDRMIDTGLYEEFGGDYLEMRVRSQDPGFSNFFWILSPMEDQAGVFRIEPEGKVIYHPWIVFDE